MKFGIFEIPYSLDYETGKVSLKQIIDSGLQNTVWADEHGFDIAFYAEHFTIGREPSPSPDVMAAAASQLTERIRLGAAGHLLPYHHPVELAHRLLFVDHMTGGRYTAGFAPGAFPTDAQLFKTEGKNWPMSVEAIDIIMKIWMERGPFQFQGQFWQVDMPAYSDDWQGPHLRPLQEPHPPVMLAGSARNSSTLALAGQRGFIPLSNGMSNEVLKSHWDTYESAAVAAGRKPNRSDWVVLRNFMVADTDAEAMDLVVNGEMGRIWREHTIKVFRRLNLLGNLLPGVPADEVNVELLAEKLWIVGSPDTVVDKFKAFHDELGGFGTVASASYNYGERSDAYRRSFELMGSEVIPRLRRLNTAAVTA